MSDNKELKAIRLHPDLIKHIEQRAEKENRNFSNMVETILWGACIKDQSK